VIKRALFERYRTAKQRLSDKGGDSHEIIFALQPSVARIIGPAKINGDTLDVFRELSSVAELLASRFGKRLVFRAHPSMERDKIIEVYRHSRIDRFADVDRLSELGDQLARCRIVMAYDSTVLWEAYVLGLVPISVQGNRFRGRLSFPHEVLDVTTTNLEACLGKLLSPETAEKYRRKTVKDNFDWENIIVGLIRGISTVECETPELERTQS
jgi:hypothetical protein